MGLLLQVEWAESDDPMRMTWRLDSKHLGGRLSMSLPSDLGTGEFVSDTICRQARTPLPSTSIKTIAALAPFWSQSSSLQEAVEPPWTDKDRRRLQAIVFRHVALFGDDRAA